MTLTIPFALLVIHFLADFVFQNDWMAINKSKRWDALALHVSIYTLAFVPYVIWRGDEWMWATFLVATWVTHFVTDAITSRATSALWFFRREDGIWAQAEYAVPKHGRTIVNPWSPIEGRRHWFFVMMGFDQLIHAATLALTFEAIR